MCEILNLIDLKNILLIFYLIGRPYALNTFLQPCIVFRRFNNRVCLYCHRPRNRSKSTGFRRQIRFCYLFRVKRGEIRFISRVEEV
jgi:hypothetical protein